MVYVQEPNPKSSASYRLKVAGPISKRSRSTSPPVVASKRSRRSTLGTLSGIIEDLKRFTQSAKVLEVGKLGSSGSTVLQERAKAIGHVLNFPTLIGKWVGSSGGTDIQANLSLLSTTIDEISALLANSSDCWTNTLTGLSVKDLLANSEPLILLSPRPNIPVQPGKVGPQKKLDSYFAASSMSAFSVPEEVIQSGKATRMLLLSKPSILAASETLSQEVPTQLD